MRRLLLGGTLAALTLSGALHAAEFRGAPRVQAYFSIPFDDNNQVHTPYFGFKTEQATGQGDEQVALTEYRVNTRG